MTIDCLQDAQVTHTSVYVTMVACVLFFISGNLIQFTFLLQFPPTTIYFLVGATMMKTAT